MDDSQKSLSRRFLAYRFFLNLWFIEAVWLYFYRLYMNDAQIGVLDAAAFGVGLLAEVPSGALADRFGRSRIVRIGIIIAGLGLALQAFGGFWSILLFQMLVMIGFSFISGADEALFFDKLNFKKESAHWRRLITRSAQAAYAACIIAIPLGGFMYQINHQAVFIINGLAILVSGLLIWNVRDSPVRRKNQKILKEFVSYAREIRQGFRVFSSKTLLAYLPIIVTVQGILYVFSWGLLKITLMDRFGFSESFGGILLGVSCAFVVLILHLMHKHAERLHEKRVLSVLIMPIALSLLVSIPDIGIFGVVVIFILYAGDGILYPFISEVINRNTESSQRATVISVASFLKTLPYVIVAPIIGWLNFNGQLAWFIVVWSALIAIAWIYYLMNNNSNEVIKVDFE